MKRIFDQRLCRALPLFLVGAVLTGLAVTFPIVGFLEWVSMIPVFFGLERLFAGENFPRKRTLFLCGFLTVLGYYLVIYHWFFSIYPLDFIGLDGGGSVAVILAGWLGLSLLQAIPGGIAFLLYGVIRKHSTRLRGGRYAKIALFAALWMLFERSSTLYGLGVPWGRLALGQTEYLPILQTASLFGSYFIGFLILAVNGLLAEAIRTGWNAGRAGIRRAILPFGLAILLCGGNLFAGALMMRKEPSGETVRVAVLQGNINSHDKRAVGNYYLAEEIYGDLARSAAAEGAKIILFHESVFAISLRHYESVKRFLSDLAVECDATLMVGALDRKDGYYLNAIYCFRPDGTLDEDEYFKRHLVPFGEYVPLEPLFSALIPPLTELTEGQTFLPGERDELFKVDGHRYGSLICFDSIYERLALDSASVGAEAIFLSTNDSWFFDSAAVREHLRQAQLRAIETGRTVIRAANTGISAIIDEKGRTGETLAPLTDGYLVADVTLSTEQTLYTKTGNLFVALCWLFCGGWLAAGMLAERKEKTEN